MLTILLNPNRSEPLYQQICAAIREEIASGALQPNEKLPSRRTLSAHCRPALSLCRLHMNSWRQRDICIPVPVPDIM
ncbi:MAG: GntR family transcriptional regulator [Ruminococcus sp.]